MTEDREDQTEPTPISHSKRTLLKAAWVAPVILSMTLPRTLMAQASPLPPPEEP